MKAKLIYDMNEPDEVMALYRAVKSIDMASFIFDLTRNSKKALSYKCEDLPDGSYQGVELAFERIYELLDQHGINIDELIS